ncbi:MAG: GGDEF domain-containing protein [Betaproteobacteria bacterium]|nr:GGDEF domain-containing protein [Betaproteobacteria bacterium]
MQFDARQQLVRYECLFKLQEDLRPLEDIQAVATLSSLRWKYMANVCTWRLLVAHQTGFYLITGNHGEASYISIEYPDEWDAYHCATQHPCVLTLPDLQNCPPLPTQLQAESVSQIQVVPIQISTQLIGLLSVTSRLEPFNDLDNKFIRLFGNYLTDHLIHLHTRQQTLQLLRSQATHDALTGALNRGAIIERMQSIAALSRRCATPMSVAIADVDFFKHVNDEYGHPAGDEVLRELTRRFKGACRTSEYFGRYGGEEFLFLFYPCTNTESVIAANRIRACVEQKPIVLDADSGQAIPVTISMGCACLHVNDQTSLEDLIKLADQALYDSKANGRNRVTLAN